jgi:hypothetical protein
LGRLSELVFLIPAHCVVLLQLSRCVLARPACTCTNSRFCGEAGDCFGLEHHPSGARVPWEGSRRGTFPILALIYGFSITGIAKCHRRFSRRQKDLQSTRARPRRPSSWMQVTSYLPFSTSTVDRDLHFEHDGACGGDAQSSEYFRIRLLSGLWFPRIVFGRFPGAGSPFGLVRF